MQIISPRSFISAKARINIGPETQIIKADLFKEARLAYGYIHTSRISLRIPKIVGPKLTSDGPTIHLGGCELKLVDLQVNANNPTPELYLDKGENKHWARNPNNQGKPLQRSKVSLRIY